MLPSPRKLTLLSSTQPITLQVQCITALTQAKRRNELGMLVLPPPLALLPAVSVNGIYYALPVSPDYAATFTWG